QDLAYWKPAAPCSGYVRHSSKIRKSGRQRCGSQIGFEWRQVLRHVAETVEVETEERRRMMTKDQSRQLIVGATAALLLSLAGFAFGAAKSDMADAVMKGDKAAVTKLLAQKADLNAPQIDGTTALHWAIFNDDSATF